MNFFFTLIYNLAIRLYFMGIFIASLWNKKAKLWRQGRNDLFLKMKIALKENETRIWFHCASVGEFEQGRPLMEAYRIRWPHHKIVLTFFSPSGYELRKNYTGADYIFYLPLDTAANARLFVSLVKPQLVFFIKYEFWYHHLKALRRNKTPTLLISGVFRENQIFFHWYGKPWRQVLSLFQQLFLQDGISLQLLQSINIQSAVLAGDTRFDRVWQIASQPKELPVVCSFKGNAKLFIAGSTWPEDESVVTALISQKTYPWKWVFVPHELQEQQLKLLRNQFGDEAIFYSQATTENVTGKRILIVDQIGLLSSIYRYSNIAYIGGGFGKGIHNVLEAAVFGIPVLFGPAYKRFNEAVALVAMGGAKSISNSKELSTAFHDYINQPDASAPVNRKFVEEQKGATEKIMAYLENLNSNTGASPR